MPGQGRQEEMPDLITGAVVAKAVSKAGSAAEPVSAGLLKRVLGPPADEFGEALRRSVAYRTRNFGKIVQRADAKAESSPSDGIVSERVAYVLLEEGSLCDDELMAEYLGGLLAGSRSPNGRDDRAVTWSRVITGLSSFQLRAHFLLYREWAARLKGMGNLELNTNLERATTEFDLTEFEVALIQGSGLDVDGVMVHSIAGLVSASLLGDDYAFGESSNLRIGPSFFDRVLRVMPSFTGMELYGWAQGLPGIQPAEFQAKAVPFELENSIPRLTGVELTFLPKQTDVNTETPAASIVTGEPGNRVG